MLCNSQYLSDLKNPPSNRLEKLKGKVQDFYSNMINDQWRIVFKWENNHAYLSEIMDYHKVGRVRDR